MASIAAFGRDLVELANIHLNNDVTVRPNECYEEILASKYGWDSFLIKLKFMHLKYE